MLKSRQEFKKKLKECKMNEHKEACQSIVDKFINKSFSKFWSEVKKQKGCLKNTNIINGENDNKKIVNIFAEKFLLHQESSEAGEAEFIRNFKEKWLTSSKMHMKISSYTLKKIISSLNSGMGHDGIHSVFLKNASDKFLDNLSLFISSCFTHCYFPDNILKGVINPTIKDRKGNITEASNYRPVMQSSCLLKIIEMHILNVLSEKNIF